MGGSATRPTLDLAGGSWRVLRPRAGSSSGAGGPHGGCAPRRRTARSMTSAARCPARRRASRGPGSGRGAPWDVESGPLEPSRGAREPSPLTSAAAPRLRALAVPSLGGLVPPRFPSACGPCPRPFRPHTRKGLSVEGRGRRRRRELEATTSRTRAAIGVVCGGRDGHSSGSSGLLTAKLLSSPFPPFPIWPRPTGCGCPRVCRLLRSADAPTAPRGPSVGALQLPGGAALPTLNKPDM